MSFLVGYSILLGAVALLMFISRKNKRKSFFGRSGNEH